MAVRTRIAPLAPVAMLTEPYVLRLLQAFCALEDMDLRRSLAELAEHMATDAFPARGAGEGESKSQRLRS